MKMIDFNMQTFLAQLYIENTIMVGPDKPAIPRQWLFQAS